MARELIVHYDQTVTEEEVNMLRKAMRDASSKYKYAGCNFLMLRVENPIPFGINSMYPEVALQNGARSDRDVSHIVVSRDEKYVYEDDFHYRTGRTYVLKTNLQNLDGLSIDEKAKQLSSLIEDQLGVMYGTNQELQDKYETEQLERELALWEQMDEEDIDDGHFDLEADDAELLDDDRLSAEDEEELCRLSRLVMQESLRESEAKNPELRLVMHPNAALMEPKVTEVVINEQPAKQSRRVSMNSLGAPMLLADYIKKWKRQ